jgi:hypothetical protein
MTGVIYGWCAGSVFDPAATEDAVAVVKNDGLTRSDGALRRGEINADVAVGERMHRTRGGGVAIADLRLAGQGSLRRFDQPVDAACLQR